MKTLRRIVLVLALTLGTAACSSSILGPGVPDGGNGVPDGGNGVPDGGNVVSG